MINKSFYTKPVLYMLNEIYEYDMSKANISILLSYGCIDQQEYDRLLSLNKKDRQISVGKMSKNKDIIKVLIKGFEESREKFILSNNINDDEILSIKKDALFILKRACNLDFDEIHFALKNYYQIYIYCKGLEIYYGEDRDDYIIDIKGINDEKLSMHQNGYLNVLSRILSMIIHGNIPDAVSEWVSFMNLYKDRKLPIQYYREFNAMSGYKLLNGYIIPDCNDISLINPSYNDEFNRFFLNVITQIYLDSFY